MNVGRIKFAGFDNFFHLNNSDLAGCGCNVDALAAIGQICISDLVSNSWGKFHK